MPEKPSASPAVSTVTSRQNPILKELQAVRDDRNSPLLFLEGPHLVQEALMASYSIEMLVVSDQFPDTSFLAPVRARSKRECRVSQSIFNVISDVDQPQGLLAICRKPSWTWADLKKRAPGPIVVIDGLQDAGNVASITRTAEAAGAAGLVTTPGTARLFSPKALRGAMGSTLRLPVLEHLTHEQIASELRGAGYSMTAASMLSKEEKSHPHTEIDWKSEPQALILGQEGRGISPAWEKLVSQRTYIPMESPVESLNVAAAAAILLYEAHRQRHAKTSKS